MPMVHVIFRYTLVGLQKGRATFKLNPWVIKADFSQKYARFFSQTGPVYNEDACDDLLGMFVLHFFFKSMDWL